MFSWVLKHFWTIVLLSETLYKLIVEKSFSFKRGKLFLIMNDATEAA